MEVNSFGYSLEQKMDVLTKQMEILMKAKIQMMTPTTSSLVFYEREET